MRLSIVLSLACSLTLLVPHLAGAQERSAATDPSAPTAVRIISGTSPGSSGDTLARILAEALTPSYRDGVVVENKVVEILNPVHRAQVLAYLHATKLQLALLINWNVAILKDGMKRVIRSS